MFGTRFDLGITGSNFYILFPCFRYFILMSIKREKLVSIYWDPNGHQVWGSIWYSYRYARFYQTRSNHLFPAILPWCCTSKTGTLTRRSRECGLWNLQMLDDYFQKFCVCAVNNKFVNNLLFYVTCFVNFSCLYVTGI